MVRRFITALVASVVALFATAQDAEMLNRPFKDFATIAFVNYNKYHPSEFIKDNNWQILCAFTVPSKVSKLDSLGIKYTKSQLQLLEMGGLLECDGDSVRTLMPIFNREQTNLLRQESVDFVDSIYPSVKPKFAKLAKLLKKQGYAAQAYSLMFSWLLDGIVWNDIYLPAPSQMTKHLTWDGVYWAHFSKNTSANLGTNMYGPLAMNWSDDLGYWPSDGMMLGVAREIMAHPDSFYVPEKLIAKASKWGICDTNGKITVPVLRMSESNPINNVANEIAKALTDKVKATAPELSRQLHLKSADEAAVIFYHEVMWDMLAKLVSDKIVEMPAILKGEETGSEHLRDITFIRLD